MMNPILVFDIDDTLCLTNTVLPGKPDELVQKVDTHHPMMQANNTISIEDGTVRLDHYLLPGTIALFTWLDMLKIEYHFFSAGLAERNIHWVAAFLEKINPLTASEKTVKMAHRNHVIHDTQKHVFSSKMKPEHEILFNFFSDKKSLLQVVKPSELAHTILIDDRPSNIMSGQLHNHLYVPGWDLSSYDISQIYAMAHIFYVAGILKLAFSKHKHTPHKPFSEVVWELQYGSPSADPNLDVVQDLQYYGIGHTVLSDFLDPAPYFTTPLFAAAEWEQHPLVQLLKNGPNSKSSFF